MVQRVESLDAQLQRSPLSLEEFPTGCEIELGECLTLMRDCNKSSISAPTVKTPVTSWRERVKRAGIAEERDRMTSPI